MTDAPAFGWRSVALIGPYLSGKTTLMEGLLHSCGAIPRKGSAKEGNTVGDASSEARDRQMSVEVSVASAQFLGDDWVFLDCPGSVEIAQEMRNALMGVDAAIVVCEPAADRAITLSPIFRFLDVYDIPHLVFINKMDVATEPVTAVLQALKLVSQKPLILRQLPIADGDAISGYVDIVSERAYRYRPGAESERIEIPEDMRAAKDAARQELMETLADFDDSLLEKLLDEEVPPTEEVYQGLAKDLRADQIVPVLFGSGEHDHGIQRLLKALRHEVPAASYAAARAGLGGAGETVAQVIKTFHAAHTGKISLARVWRGEVKDGMTLNGERVSGLFRMMGQQQEKIAAAGPGEIVACGRMEEVKTGDLLTPSGTAPEATPPWPGILPPTYSIAISAENRADEVKMTGAIAKLVEEDPSLSMEQNPDTLEMLLWGQGEIHLGIALDRLKSKYNVPVAGRAPRVPYKETIRKSASQHGRFKRQTGGHGQFGDVHLDIKPVPRGRGFEFGNSVVGGAVPRQYIPGVEVGVREFLKSGPLGFPVVDVSVTLTDGQHHAVDSSEQAFRQAARIAMTEGMAKCDPVLLEPVMEVTISVPADATSKMQQAVSRRRGQILGFNAKEGWRGWDEVNAHMPQSELHDLIVELRSATLGIGFYTWKFDHLQEITGKISERVLEARAAAEVNV